jgi:hypothetical protein
MKLFVLPNSRNGNNSDLPRQNLLASSIALQSKAKALQPSTQTFPTKGNSSKC